MSTTFDQAAFAHNTDEGLLTLLKIDGSELSTPIRIVHARENVTHNLNTYIAFPFYVSKPKRIPNELPTSQLTICNVDRSIALAVRDVSEALLVTVKSVLLSDPDSIEDGPYELYLRDVGIKDFFVTGTLSMEDIGNELYPADIFDPVNAPGIF